MWALGWEFLFLCLCGKCFIHQSVALAQLHIPNENNCFQNRTSVRRVALFMWLGFSVVSRLCVCPVLGSPGGHLFCEVHLDWQLDTPGKGEPQLGNCPYPCLIALWVFLWGWSLWMWEGPACCEQHHPQASGPGLYEKVRRLPPNSRVLWPFPF